MRPEKLRCETRFDRRRLTMTNLRHYHSLSIEESPTDRHD